MNYNPFKGALICSIVVVAFGLIYHARTVIPNNFPLVILWLPVYISPLWGIAGISYLSEKGRKE